MIKKKDCHCSLFLFWCPGLDSNQHIRRTLPPQDSASTNSATRAFVLVERTANVVQPFIILKPKPSIFMIRSQVADNQLARELISWSPKSFSNFDR